MRWQNAARLVVVLVGLGCAVTVYVTLRQRPETGGTPASALLDAGATAATKGTFLRQVDAEGREVFSMESDSSRELADGRSIHTGARLRIPKNGVVYTVTAEEAESAGRAGPTGEEPSTIVFRRTVRMTGEDGFSVSTEDATYLNVEQRVTFPGALAFTRGQLSGEGVGGDLFMERSVLWLYDQAEMRVAPEADGAPAVVTAKRIGLAEADNYLRAEEGARLTREDQEMSSDLMMVYFAEGTQAVRRIELDGQSRVTQAGSGRQPDMRADQVNLDFAQLTSSLSRATLKGSAVLTTQNSSGSTRVSGTEIEMVVGADGQTLTRLAATAPTEVQLPRTGETPARIISSSGLVAEGNEPAGLDRAVFSGGVEYRERRPATRGEAASERVAKSDSLVLGLGGTLDQVNAAEFRQNFSVQDGAMTAQADQGLYDAQAETLQLRAGVPVRIRPNMVSEEFEVTAQAIDVDLKEDGFDAREKVTSLRQPTVKPSGTQGGATGLFETGRPIRGQADRLTYSKATGVAVYTGAVALLQDRGDGEERSTIQANRVQFDEKKQDLAADGNVRSTFFIDQSPDGAGKVRLARTVLAGDRMVYTEAARTVVYSGAARMESEDGQRLRAGEITLTMVAERRALERLEAVAADKDLLLLTLPEDRQVSGRYLTYDAESDQYVVLGEPAMFVSRAKERGPDVCEVGTGTDLSFLRTQGFSDVKNKGGAVGKAGDQKCSEVIK